jgi:hypothetical protein
VKTLEDTGTHQQAQIAALEKHLADAKQQVQDIAVKAIEGASGARARSPTTSAIHDWFITPRAPNRLPFCSRQHTLSSNKALKAVEAWAGSPLEHAKPT